MRFPALHPWDVTPQQAIAIQNELRARVEVIGAVVRTRQRVRPVYVSIGHRVSLETAIAFLLRATTRFRLPETTRQAHRLASR